MARLISQLFASSAKMRAGKARCSWMRMNSRPRMRKKNEVCQSIKDLRMLRRIQRLSEIDKILHQLEGALAVLALDDAVHAIKHTQAAVQRFAQADAAPELAEFQQVAKNVGA